MVLPPASYDPAPLVLHFYPLFQSALFKITNAFQVYKFLSSKFALVISLGLTPWTASSLRFPLL